MPVLVDHVPAACYISYLFRAARKLIAWYKMEVCLMAIISRMCVALQRLILISGCYQATTLYICVCAVQYWKRWSFPSNGSPTDDKRGLQAESALSGFNVSQVPIVYQDQFLVFQPGCWEQCVLWFLRCQTKDVLHCVLAVHCRKVCMIDGRMLLWRAELA